MGWFKRKIDPMTSRSRELHSEIAALESQIAQLSNASTLGDPLQIHTVLKETRYLPPDPILRADEALTHSLPPVTDSNCPSLYNDQGVRKFDLAGWWLRAPAPTRPLPHRQRQARCLSRRRSQLRLYRPPQRTPRGSQPIHSPRFRPARNALDRPQPAHTAVVNWLATPSEPVSVAKCPPRL